MPSQLPDIDPDETSEWLESLDAVVKAQGRGRARYLMLRLLQEARAQQVGVPALRSTDYINTIPPESEPEFPGDEHIERRIRAFIRWNAAIMVSRANRPGLGVGGHIATYASSASLIEVGFNHFFRGKDGGGAGDQIFFQGHASPGIYARAFLEGRISDRRLDGFRQELSHASRRRTAVVPPPPAHAGLLGVPDGLDGARPHQRHLPGAVQPLPPLARDQGHLALARVGLPR
jgi:pyruvate dehydrogenase E1 component